MKNINLLKNTIHKCLRLLFFLVIAGIIIAAIPSIVHIAPTLIPSLVIAGIIIATLAFILVGLCHVPLHHIAPALIPSYVSLLWILRAYYL